MQPSPELIDEIFTRKVRRAREANPVEKMLDGARLFDMVCRWPVYFRARVGY
jgi:hypothetical protein